MRVELPAHCPDELVNVERDFNVRIVDATHAPWYVVFEGAEADLRAMFAAHWESCDQYPNFDDLEKT